MSDCVICQGMKTIRLPVYRKVSFTFDASAALALEQPEEMYRTYECPECSGQQAAEEKVSIVYAEQTVRTRHGDEKGLKEAVAHDLARATADKLLREGLIEIKSEKCGENTLFYSKLGAVSPRAVHRLEARAFDKMKEMLGNVLTRARESIAVWGSHYTGNEGMISKQQAMDYVEAAFRNQMREASEAIKALVAAPGEPVSLLEIGPVLVLEKQYTEHEVLNALFSMQAEKVIELLNGNRMRVL